MNKESKELQQFIVGIVKFFPQFCKKDRDVLFNYFKPFGLVKIPPEPGTILKEISPGYKTTEGRVIKPAKVIVQTEESYQRQLKELNNES